MPTPTRSCKSLCSAKTRCDTKTSLRLTEHCILRADTDITAHRDLAAAAKSESVYCSDNRDWEESQWLAEHIVSLLTEGLSLCLCQCCSSHRYQHLQQKTSLLHLSGSRHLTVSRSTASSVCIQLIKNLRCSVRSVPLDG